jgi:hypothetical protein
MKNSKYLIVFFLITTTCFAVKDSQKDEAYLKFLEDEDCKKASYTSGLFFLITG